MSKLEGKRVLITGGAQGIGLQMAMKFAGRGAEIVLADINADKLAEATRHLDERGAVASGFQVDVTNPASIASLRAQIAAEAGPIDVLVNNAGVVFGGPFATTPLDQHFKTYEVNVLGLVAMTLSPALAARALSRCLPRATWPCGCPWLSPSSRVSGSQSRWNSP